MIGQWLTLMIAAYLIGGIPFGLLVSRLRGIDIRRHGSGNYGATNVGRVLGRKWGVLVLLLDASKGAVVSIFAGPFLSMLCGRAAGILEGDWAWLAAGLCCVVGNTAPVYLKFRGGKGVATSLGVILGIFPYLTYPALAALAVWIAAVLMTRYVSLASLLAAVTVPTAFLFFSRLLGWPLGEHYPLLALSAGAAVLVIVRHRTNIGRLLAGTESRIGGPRPAP